MYKLAVIPSDPLSEYEKKGISSKLEEYYNPLGFFGKVYLLSPLENEQKFQYGMYVIPVKDKELPIKLKELDVDIVRAYGGYWPCDMACIFRRKDIPVIVSVHDRRPQWLHNTIKKADIVFAVSREVKDLVISKGQKPENVWILPNRVDLGLMKPLEESEYRDISLKYKHKYKILHVGRKSEEKNLDKIIRALKILGSEYCLIAIGKGDESEYADIAKHEGVSERVYFLQQVENKDLCRYFSFSDCVCNPSSTEAMSSALVEAMACGAAVVTSTIAARGVGMKNEEDSLLISDYNNPEEIAEAIRSVCENHELRNRLEKGALESAKKYDKEKIDRIEADYYHRILRMKENGDFRKNSFSELSSTINRYIYRGLKKAAALKAGRNG